MHKNIHGAIIVIQPIYRNAGYSMSIADLTLYADIYLKVSMLSIRIFKHLPL